MRLTNYIIKHGTVKMFKYYILKNNIDLNQSAEIINSIFQDNSGMNLQIVAYLINESNLKYSYRISKEIYERMNFNFRFNSNELVVRINNDVMTDFDLRLDKLITGSNYFYVIFQKYKKCFLVITKSLNPPKLGKKDFTNILKYL
jgi:hypothetical protein